MCYIKKDAVIQQGMSWPEDQAFPIFSLPSETLSLIKNSELSADERLTFATFQGLVNREKTEILIVEEGDVDQFIWPDTFQFQYVDMTARRYELFHQYKDRVKGLVVYDTTKSLHYRNAASTIANIKGYLPVTPTIKNQLQTSGVSFSEVQVFDITTWEETTSLDIHSRIYQEFWPMATKRLLIVANPGIVDADGNLNEDLDHCRDIAAAVGAAVVFMDTFSEEERALFEKYVKDMADSDCISMILGWGMSERSAITASSKYGIGFVPANFYISASVYSGLNHTIHVPKVPKRPAIANKAYIACYMSDGDNIQFTQRAMRGYWDQEAPVRGKVAMNWTMAPTLIDIGPGIMNYYYDSATKLDCFVTGPSGISFLIPTNTGGDYKSGIYLTERKYADAYTKLTERYLQKTGLRVVTVWDDAEETVRESYEQNCRSLYGMVLQQFGDSPVVKPSIVNNRLFFDKHNICYSGQYDWFYRDASGRISEWIENGADQALFLSYQFDRWHIEAEDVLRLQEELQKAYPGKVEFVRADHYFSYYNEQNKLPVNLAMLEAVTVESNVPDSNPEKAADGTFSSVWSTAFGKDQEVYLQFDFGKEYMLTRYLIRQAAAAGFEEDCNVKEYEIQVSLDKTNWTTVEQLKAQSQEILDVDMDNIPARYFRILVRVPGRDQIVRIADVEVYGKSIK